MTIRYGAIAAATATLTLLAACTTDSNGDNDTTPHTDSPDAQVEAPTNGESDNGDAGSGSADSDYLDTLYADSLHDGITPADPGTAYIEIEGQRIEFTSLVCIISDTPGAERFRVDAAENPEQTGSSMFLDREVGDDIGWNFEDELAQLALLTTPATDDSLAMYSNSMVQHEREQGGDPQWDFGDGASPVIRVVGNQATATGVMEGVPFAESPLVGEFIAAATCP